MDRLTDWIKGVLDDFGQNFKTYYILYFCAKLAMKQCNMLSLDYKNGQTDGNMDRRMGRTDRQDSRYRVPTVHLQCKFEDSD